VAVGRQGAGLFGTMSTVRDDAHWAAYNARSSRPNLVAAARHRVDAVLADRT